MKPYTLVAVLVSIQSGSYADVGGTNYIQAFFSGSVVFSETR